MFYEYGDGRIELVNTETREVIKVVKEGTGHNPYLKNNG